MDYETKIVELEKTLLHLEDETAKAEAELRGLIHCLKIPDSYPEPEWFKKELKELTDHFIKLICLFLGPNLLSDLRLKQHQNLFVF